MKHDRKSAVTLMVFAVLVFMGGKSIPTAAMQREIGAGAFVMLLAILLFILSVALFVTAGKRKKSMKHEGEEKVASQEVAINESMRDRITRILKAVAALTGYIIALPYLGFVISTALFGIVFLCFVYKSKIVKSLIPSLAIAAFGYVVFQMILQIPLPAFMEAIR